MDQSKKIEGGREEIERKLRRIQELLDYLQNDAQTTQDISSEKDAKVNEAYNLFLSINPTDEEVRRFTKYRSNAGLQKEVRMWKYDGDY